MDGASPRTRLARRLSLAVLTLAVAGGALAAAPRPKAGVSERTLTLQAALDRAGVSPGLIDGRSGTQTKQALALFQRARGLTASGALDAPTRAALQLDAARATRTYTVTAADAAGPFVAEMPTDLMSQGALPALGYTSIVELLGERFHTDAALLRALNRKARFAAGDTVRVPDVEPMAAPAESKRRDGPGQHAARVGRIVVSRSTLWVTVFGTDGALLFAAPVTLGSEHDPLPLGEWQVTNVYLLPVFHYNPALFWDADPAHAQTVIKPGPNNPAGVAWIDIDREHYGLHGTPEPESVGRSASHGCVRLTNWDIARLLDYVKPGTRVIFEEETPDVQPTR